jgi:predicted nuclease of predicted toxin-antitoxin system
MRFIVNENVSANVIGQLRAKGHDVLSVKESMRGGTDRSVLTRAQAEERVVLTHDKDFGELAFRYDLPAGSGVILLRLGGDNPATDNKRALEAIESRDDWMGHFSVITDERIRMRPLPSAAARTEGTADDV